MHKSLIHVHNFVPRFVPLARFLVRRTRRSSAGLVLTRCYAPTRLVHSDGGRRSKCAGSGESTAPQKAKESNHNPVQFLYQECGISCLVSCVHASHLCRRRHANSCRWIESLLRAGSDIGVRWYQVIEESRRVFPWVSLLLLNSCTFAATCAILL